MSLQAPRDFLLKASFGEKSRNKRSVHMGARRVSMQAGPHAVTPHPHPCHPRNRDAAGNWALSVTLGGGRERERGRATL